MLLFPLQVRKRKFPEEKRATQRSRAGSEDRITTLNSGAARVPLRHPPPSRDLTSMLSPESPCGCHSQGADTPGRGAVPLSRDLVLSLPYFCNEQAERCVNCPKSGGKYHRDADRTHGTVEWAHPEPSSDLNREPSARGSAHPVSGTPEARWLPAPPA